MMKPGARKLALTTHVASSVGTIGSVAAFLCLALAGLTSGSEPVVRAAYIAMELVSWFVIVPLVGLSMLTGLIQALGTHWGLFRHYWVLIKFLLTCLVIGVLLLQTEAIGVAAQIATGAEMPLEELLRIRMSLAVHAGAGLLVLLIVETLSVYKPQGLTPYGIRKLRAALPR